MRSAEPILQSFGSRKQLPPEHLVIAWPSVFSYLGSLLAADDHIVAPMPDSLKRCGDDPTGDTDCGVKSISLSQGA